MAKYPNSLDKRADIIRHGMSAIEVSMRAIELELKHVREELIKLDQEEESPNIDPKRTLKIRILSYREILKDRFSAILVSLNVRKGG